MRTYQQEFIDNRVEARTLIFGTFVLKSGRDSPYFLNAAGVNAGNASYAPWGSLSVIALDGMERGYGGALSAIEEIKKLFHLPITSIVTFDDFIERLEGSPAYQESLAQMRDYRERYATTAKYPLSAMATR